MFEHVDHTLLEDLDRNTSGLERNAVKRCMYQLLKALDFIHSNNVACALKLDDPVLC